MYKTKRPGLGSGDEQCDRQVRERSGKSGKRTAREAQNWPEGGYKALSKLAKELYSEVDVLLKKKQWNTKDMYHFQRYLIVLFYSKHALRGDLADVRIAQPFANNWLRKTGGAYVLHVGTHKTSRAHGAIELRIAGEMKEALDVFLPQVLRLTDHGFLLSTLRGANKLKRQDMLRLIRNVTKDRLGKNIGVQIIRVLKVSDAAPEIDKALALQKELGHSASMQQKYISRGGWSWLTLYVLQTNTLFSGCWAKSERYQPQLTIRVPPNSCGFTQSGSSSLCGSTRVTSPPRTRSGPYMRAKYIHTSFSSWLASPLPTVQLAIMRRQPCLAVHLQPYPAKCSS